MDNFDFDEGLVPYQPPLSLWKLIQSRTPPHELDSVKDMLGVSLVDQSIELQEEVATLLSILEDIRDETKQLLTKHRLPEPPGLRDMLKDEIKFFVNTLRVKAKEHGRDESDYLIKHRSDIIDYALDSTRPPSSGYESHPSTARSRPSTCKSIRNETPSPPFQSATSLSRLSQTSTSCPFDQEHYSIVDFDKVVQRLRSSLEDEVHTLTLDIDYLQKCLEDELDYRDQPSRAPSIAEMREERKSLENDFFSVCKNDLQPADHPAPVTPPGLGAGKKTPAIKPSIVNSPVNRTSKLVKPNLHPTPPTKPSEHGKTRPSPLKGTHTIRIVEIEQPPLRSPRTTEGVDDKQCADKQSHDCSRPSRHAVPTLGTSVKAPGVKSGVASGTRERPGQSPVAQRFRKMVQEYRMD